MHFLSCINLFSPAMCTSLSRRLRLLLLLVQEWINRSSSLARTPFIIHPLGEKREREKKSRSKKLMCVSVPLLLSDRKRYDVVAIKQQLASYHRRRSADHATKTVKTGLSSIPSFRLTSLARVESIHLFKEKLASFFFLPLKNFLFFSSSFFFFNSIFLDWRIICRKNRGKTVRHDELTNQRLETN